MVILGLILSLMLGFSVITAVGVKLSKIEALGLSMLLGLVCQSFIVFILDAASISLSALTSTLGAVVTLAGLSIFNFKRRRDFWKGYTFKFEWRNINAIWLLAIVLVGYIEYMNWAKTLYIPPFDRDSLAGFETIGFVMAREGTFHAMSLFDASYMPAIAAPGSYITYAPMVQMCYGWVYMLGAETSKIIPAIIFLSFLITLYGAIRRSTNDMTAAIALVFVLLAPEFTAFASLSATNVMHAAYASLGVIYGMLWFKSRDLPMLILGSLLLASNVWIRSEGVVFIAAVGLLMIIDAIKSKRWINAWYMVGISITPMVAWALYCSAFGLQSQSVTIMQPFWDGGKADTILTYFISLIVPTQYYGYTFIAFAIALLASAYYIVRWRSDWRIPAVVIVSMLLYGLMLYHIDYRWDTITNVLAYSAKRFFFCFIPICWYYVAVCTPVSTVMGKLNTFLAPSKV